MKIFFKYVMRSMLEKKGRFFLLITAIAISTALLVVSTGMVDIILDSFVRPQLEAFENKDIVVSTTDTSLRFFSDEGLNTSGLKEDSIVKEIYIDAMIPDKVDTEDETMLNVSIRGRNSEFINKDIIIKGNLNDYKGPVCVISERTSKEHNWNTGDTIKMIIGGLSKDIKVIAVSGTQGVFYNDSATSFSMYIPYEFLSNDLNAAGKYNIIFANSSEATIKEGVDKFNSANTQFKAERMFNEEAVQKQLSSYTTLLYMLMIVVVALSGIIIYSSFKLIITERLTTIGTFLSQGATTGKVKSILYLESLTYGIFGSIAGNALGIGALNIIVRYMSPLKAYGIYGKVDVKPSYLIAGTIFAVILSVISSILPVRKISKLQVKDVILNDVRISKEIGWKKCIAGIIIFAISFIIYLVGKKSLGAYAAILTITSLTGVILAYPKLIDIISKVLFRILRGRSKNVIFAINNLRTSKILLGNISLIIISLVSIISIASIGTSIVNVVTEAYTELNYDIEISGISTIRATEDSSTAEWLAGELKKLGVRDSDINQVRYQYGSINAAGTNNETQFAVMGVDIDKYASYNQYLHLDKEEYKDTINNLKNSDSQIIITNVLSKLSGKNAGDEIELKCNGIKKTLKIAGVIDGKLFNNGYFMIMKDKTIGDYFGMLSADTITFSTDKDTDAMMKELKPILRSIGATAKTRDAMCAENVANNQMLVSAMKIFSYMAIIIAALGIVNNVSISFIQRKSEFAILSSVGMTDAGRRRILIFESVASVIWAMIITTLYCIFGLKLITIASQAIGFGDLEMILDYSALPGVLVAALVVVVLATLPACFRSRKLSIIQEIKYE